jgi:hypothetical protein
MTQTPITSTWVYFATFLVSLFPVWAMCSICNIYCSWRYEYWRTRLAFLFNVIDLFFFFFFWFSSWICGGQMGLRGFRSTRWLGRSHSKKVLAGYSFGAYVPPCSCMILKVYFWSLSLSLSLSFWSHAIHLSMILARVRWLLGSTSITCK